MPGPRTARRRLIGAIVIVLGAFFFGAVVSVAIAIWGANTRPGKPRWVQTPTTGAVVSPTWDVEVTCYNLITTTTISLHAPIRDPEPPEREAVLALLPGTGSHVAFAELPTHNPASSFTFQCSGWPLNCMAWQGPQGPFGRLSRRGEPESALVRWRPPWSSDWIGVPLIPLWRNLVADSAFFGAPCLVVGLAIAPFRRRRRRRKGLCPICTYDLLHDLKTGCPECGWNRQIVEPIQAS